MSLIRHCIVDTNTNLIVNIIDYETEQTGIPPRLESNLICIKNDDNYIGDSYNNGVFIKKPEPPQPQLPPWPPV